MGITKKNLFTASQNELAGLAKILGHPARIAILDYLVKSNMSINEVVDKVKEHIAKIHLGKK